MHTHTQTRTHMDEWIQHKQNMIQLVIIINAIIMASQEFTKPNAHIGFSNILAQTPEGKQGLHSLTEKLGPSGSVRIGLYFLHYY